MLACQPSAGARYTGLPPRRPAVGEAFSVRLQGGRQSGPHADTMKPSAHPASGGHRAPSPGRGYGNGASPFDPAGLASAAEAVLGSSPWRLVLAGSSPKADRHTGIRRYDQAAV
jgi:hypothetical protein